jgi:hypothetical protein
MAATGAELMALRSAAVEVAVGAYADGIRKRRRHVPAASAVTFVPNTSGVARPGRSGPRLAESITCLLSPEVIDDLDEVLGATPDDGAGPEPVSELKEAREVVIEAAIGSWLILRGYSALVPAGTRFGGVLGIARLLASRRRQGRPK